MIRSTGPVKSISSTKKNHTMVKQQSWFSLAILACYLLAGVLASDGACDTPPQKGKCAEGMYLIDIGSGCRYYKDQRR